MRRRFGAIAAAVLESLRGDPVTAGLRLKLAAGILGPEAFELELQRLVGDDVPISAVAGEATAAVEQIGKTRERAKLQQLEVRLAAADDPHLRLLAFTALLAQARDHIRWDEVRRSRLSAYRNDPAPLVAIRPVLFRGKPSMILDPTSPAVINCDDAMNLHRSKHRVFATLGGGRSPRSDSSVALPPPSRT